MTELSNIQNLLCEILKLLEIPFYQRRRSSIKKYVCHLECLNKICNKIYNKYKKPNNLWYLFSDYNETWAKHDFYSNLIRSVGSIIYDYTESILYHQYRKICTVTVTICIQLMDESKIPLVWNNDILSDLQNIATSLKLLHSDNSTIRYT